MPDRSLTDQVIFPKRDVVVEGADITILPHGDQGTVRSR